MTVAMFGDRYAIIGELGSGGNGTVYRVHDDKIGRDLALKLLNNGEEIFAVREAHALTALESPHVLRVFNAGIHGDVPFIATEVATLGSTEDRLKGTLGISPQLATRWVRHALVGLDYCHRRRILHRDLTTGNIFLHSEDHALLGDFGAATNLDEYGSAPPGGNQRCRAPEGFGGRLTAASDIFSAGVALWKLLTARWPYEAGTEDELAQMMRTNDRPRLRDVAPHVHRSIAAVVESALAPDPLNRPNTAAEMGLSLAKCQTHQRNWTRTLPDGTGDLVYISSAAGVPLKLSVEVDGARRVVTTRHVGSGTRVTKACFTTSAAKLNIELRRTFDSL
ncbi:MAG: serine/threonine-protein kinase [Thermomicrobiales bacterium]